MKYGFRDRMTNLDDDTCTLMTYNKMDRRVSKRLKPIRSCIRQSIELVVAVAGNRSKTMRGLTPFRYLPGERTPY